MQLLAAGRNVVAAARSAEKAELFAELEPDSAPGKLFIRTGVDVTDASTLGDELLEGVTQIVSAVGPVSTAAGNTPHSILNVCALAVHLHPATAFASGIHQVLRCTCNKHSHARRAYSG
jgi:NAD(P)-dependent dehydrogenase (short-subunit alcohol dehydrogenase family)